MHPTPKGVGCIAHSICKKNPIRYNGNRIYGKTVYKRSGGIIS